MARDSAGASSAQPGLSNSRSVRANMTNFLLLSNGPLGPLCFSFGRRFGPLREKRKRERRGLPSSPFSKPLGLVWAAPLRERPFIDRSRLFRGLRHNGFDVDVFATKLAIAETHATVGECKKRMVFAQADVRPRVPTRAALTYDDVSAAN